MQDWNEVTRMLFLNQIRDWIRTLDAAENYYIGRMNDKEKSLGVFQLSPRPPTRAIGQQSSYEVRRISLKLHWNKNQNESERAAWELYSKLRAVSSCRFDIENTHVYFIDLLQAEPVSIYTDENGVYEWVIEFEMYYERND